TILEDNGFAATTAKDGTEAVAMIDQALIMPDDTFTELTAEITRTGEGGNRIVRATCVPFRGRNGVNIGTITVLNDITALKEFDRIRSDFVSMVCHEVRSPMNSMMMQLKVVLDGLAGELSGKQREILERVSEKMLGLTAMVSELLDLSRLESGLIASEKSAVNMAELFREQVAFHEANAARKAITLTIDIPESLPPVLANQRSMEEVLTNLITNAIKYSPEGSAVSLEARIENEYLHFSVQDNGYGIPEEDLKRIFDRFYRVNDENTRAIVGTGLGLAIVKSIVDAHHGSIKVASKPGAGSTFTVLLPLADI
ncbi:MAG: ATP-binding protein, partial [Desulfofustis sp.]|nr:ATP-binding protein [Desulfofustis sp.]